MALIIEKYKLKLQENMAIEVTDDNFETEVINSKTPVLVDFWAEWCGPCKMLSPVLDELSAELASKIKIVKMNVDDNPKTPSEIGIRGIPTMIIYKDGEAVATKVGASPKGSIIDRINSSI